MAEAAGPQRPPSRFFCHRCNVEFEDLMQNYTCPFCLTGFIERLELDDEDYSDADMENPEHRRFINEVVQASLDGLSRTTPIINDLTLLMTSGRLRPVGARRGEGRSLMDQLVWMVGGGRGTGAVTAGAPFVLVGAPGDYVFGGEGLDAVVTHLLGQLENTGPPPLPREQIQAIPSEQITEAHVDSAMSCSVCWDNFTLGETVSRLECTHMFHPACITPWLQLHATCPICRRQLRTHIPEQQAPSAVGSEMFASPASSSTNSTQEPRPNPALAHVVVRRVRRYLRQRSNPSAPAAAAAPPASDSSSDASRATTWSHPPSDVSPSPSSTSYSSERERDREYMDIDYD